ncbi:helix-turn-helix domain-containing protein [Phenylobacterium terrae]|uniref:Helix-turn-helix domain-containing protein n=1 Tax=Phenylobacterium terrae TaxID=2665495 RepID=A0ABW4N6H2_9CAUL
MVWDGEVLSLHPAQSRACFLPVSLARPNVGLRLACGVGGLVAGSPGAAVPLLLEEAWGSLARTAATRLRRTRDPEKQLEVLNWLVLERREVSAAPDPLILDAVDQIRRLPSGAIRDVSDRVGLSARELRRRFAIQVGLSPKALHRVARAQMLLRALRAAGPEIELARLAADLGYADQAHMTHECRTIVGATPGQLKRRMVS